MGRYILIEFDDNESAKKLKKQIDTAAKLGKPFRTVGYYASPDGPSCTCPSSTYTYERGKPFSPSKFIRKTGWRKCQVCGNYRVPMMMVNLIKPDRLINPITYITEEYKSKKAKNFIHYFSSISSYTMLKARDEQ